MRKKIKEWRKRRRTYKLLNKFLYGKSLSIQESIVLHEQGLIEFCIVLQRYTITPKGYERIYERIAIRDKVTIAIMILTIIVIIVGEIIKRTT